MTDRKNPWAGLASYLDGDSRLFCGRDNESYDVAMLVDNNIFVTLYGKSGIGKSSLLNAGVFPRLRQMGYLPVAVRLGIEAEGMSLQDCIVKKLEATVASVGSVRTCEIVSMPEEEQEETWLWSYFARSRFEDNTGLVLFPVLVFDQFEEVFRSRPREAGVLLRQIHYMMDESHAIPTTKDYSYDFNFRFIVSIREDELYRLEDSLDGNYLPDMKKCRYRLRDLSPKGVRDVILIPGGPFIAKGEEDAVVEAVTGAVRGTSGGAVSTNILSLVCSRAYDEMVRKGRSEINQELIGEIVSDNLFEKYYLEATAGLPAEARRYIEDHLVDSADRRNSVSELDFFKAVPDGEVLIEDGPRKILQRVSVASDTGQTRIELVHDSFCEPIARFRRKRQHRRRNYVAAGAVLAALLVFGISALIIHNMKQREWKMLENQSRFVAETAIRLANEGDYYMAKRLAAAALPKEPSHPKDRPYVTRAEYALWKAWGGNGGFLRGHTSGVYSVAFTPDGDYIVSGSKDSTVRVWKAESGEAVICLKGHSGTVNSVAVHPKGKHVASASEDKTIIIWDFESGEQVGAPLKGHTARVNSVVYSPDGQYVCSASSDSTVRIWNSNTGEIIGKPLRGHTDQIMAISISPDGNYLASGSHDRTIRIWDIQSGDTQSVIRFLDDEDIEGKDSYVGQILSIAFSPDGKNIVAGDAAGIVKVFDFRTRRQVHKLTQTGQRTGSVTSVAYSPDGKRILSCTVSSKENIYAWDSETGQQIGSPLDGHSAGLKTIAINSSGTQLVSGSYDNTIQVWDLSQSLRHEIIPDEDPSNNLEKWFRMTPKESRNAIAISPDGQKIVFAGFVVERYSEGNDPPTLREILTLVDAESGEQIGKHWEGHTDCIVSIAFSPDGNRVVSGSYDKTIRIWDVETGISIGVPLSGHTGEVYSVAFSPDGKLIASGAEDNTVRIWNAETGEILFTLEGHTSPVKSVAFSPDGKSVVSCSDDGTIRMWDSQTGKCIGEPLDGSDVSIRFVAYDLDGKTIVTVDANLVIRIWDVKTGEVIQTAHIMRGRDYPRISYSPKRKRVLSSDGYSVRIWDIESGEPSCELMYRAGITCVAISQEGDYFVWGCVDTFGRIDISLEDGLDKTREKYPPLTPEERRQYYLE